MEGPNTSRSALTGTCTLPGSKTQEKLGFFLHHRRKWNLRPARRMISKVKSSGGVKSHFQIFLQQCKNKMLNQKELGRARASANAEQVSNL